MRPGPLQLFLAAWLACAGAAVAAPPGPLTPEERAWLAAQGELVVAPEASYPPFVFCPTDGGPPQGLSWDTLELVQAKLGVRFRVAPAADLSEQLALAQAGELDVLTSLKRTPEREAFLAFTAPYVSVPAVIIVRRELAADLTLADLRGKRVTVGDGYGVHAWLSQRAPDLALEPVGNDLIGLRRVAFGEADAAIMDLASASWFIEHEGIGNLRVGGDTGYTYDLSFAVRKDLAPLRGILDKGLAQLSELERAEIRERWITLSGREYRLRRQLSLVLWFLGAVGLVALLVIGSNATLKRQVLRRTAELAQRTRDAQALADAIPDLVLHLSAEGAVLALNAPPACSLGLASVEARGQPLSELALPAALHEGLLRGMRQALATGALCAQELSWDGPHGARVVDARAVPTGTQAVVWIVRNVTEQRAAERRQRELDEQAIHAQKLESLGVLAGGIAHDFNNLLATILGNTELARARLGPQDPAAERLQDVATAAERAAQLCRLLLAYAGRGEFRLTVLDLAAFVRDLENLLRASCAKSTALALELPAEPVWVEVDAGQLQQVLMNLVINGSEAIGEAPGQVTVRVRSAPWTADELATVAPERLPPGDYAELEVEDTGCGMEPEVRARIFEPFFTTKFTGRGLGMSAVLGILQRLRGGILVESEAGAGSRFVALVPRRAAPAAAVEAPPRVAAPTAPAPGGTLLVADDEEILRRMTAAVLRDEGYDVLEARSGREALELFGAHPEVQGVVLDQTMPDMSGVQVFGALQAIRPVPVLFVSGYSEQEIAPQVEDRPGFAGFLSKPFATAELLARVQAMLPQS